MNLGEFDLISQIKEIAKHLGAEYYCNSCEKHFCAKPEVECCPYCKGNDLYIRNNLMGHVVECDNQ